MSQSNDIISARREHVLQAYNSAKAENYLKFLEGDYKATSEYIYPNQIADAHNIVDQFYNKNKLVISIQKKTKVGADGLMIEIAKLLTTHIDDNFVINQANVRIITGMSNAGWEKDMIEKAPNFFKGKIFHHGKLSRSDLMSISNGLIIIDEIDTGDKEFQVLHNTLKEAGVLNVDHMKQHKNKFVFISATMIKELYDLYRWGDFHQLYTMTVIPLYIGHGDMLKKGIIKEFYDLGTINNAEKWVKEDILDNYKTDFRVHIVRVNAKIANIVQNACIRNNVEFRNHTSTERLLSEEIQEFFKDSLDRHIVLGVKGFFRRANLIPDKWKVRIGAVCELFTKTIDNNVQVQGLLGRMTGYWSDIIEAGHKTGPYRSSVKAIEEYEKIYIDPFGINSYQTSGFKKKKGRVFADSTMLSVQNISGLDPIDFPEIARTRCSQPVIKIELDIETISYIKENIKNNITNIMQIIQKHNQNVFEQYKTYEAHCWNMDTEQKYIKWGLSRMIEEGAYSTETNISDKTKNILMIYCYENQLILNPWSGQQ